MPITPTDRYQKANIRRIVIQINRKLEPELLEYVEQHKNKQGYILDLIRSDMAEALKSKEE